LAYVFLIEFAKHYKKIIILNKSVEYNEYRLLIILTFQPISRPSTNTLIIRTDNKLGCSRSTPTL